MRHLSLRRAFVAFSLIALALPTNAFAKGKLDPSEEFMLKPWISIHLGPLDLSITKAVVYLFLGTILTIVLGLTLMRARLRQDTGRRQTVGEMVYDMAQDGIAAQGLPTKAMGRLFPYVASLFLFILVLNFISFIPLQLTGETFHLFEIGRAHV